jgi:hypothetical protein
LLGTLASYAAKTTFVSRLLWPTEPYRNGIDNLNLIAERVFSNASDDRSWDIIQIVSGVGVVNENDVEAPRKGTTNRCADTHLRQQTCYGNASHMRTREHIRKLGTIEAVVPRFAEDELARLWGHLGMDVPAGRSRLVKCPSGSIILQMDDQAASGSRRRQDVDEAADNTYGIRNGCLAVEQTLLHINHQ